MAETKPPAPKETGYINTPWGYIKWDGAIPTSYNSLLQRGLLKPFLPLTPKQ